MVQTKRVAKSNEFAKSLIDAVREPMIILDQDLRVVTVSRSFYEFFNVNSEETIGQLIYDLGNRQWDIPKLRGLLKTILPQQTSFDDYEVVHNFISIGRRIMLLNAREIQKPMGKERAILLAIEDITKRMEMEQEIKRIAYHDHLTGLPNRMLLFDRLNMALHQADRHQNKVAIMMLDIDKFKNINDNLGHHIGDMLLLAVAKKLSRILRKGDTVARFGGDEFVLVFPGQRDIKTALHVARKITDSFRQAFVIEKYSLMVSSSIGFSLYPDHGKDVNTLIKTADSAMYYAKQAGRNQYRGFYELQRDEPQSGSITMYK